MEEAFAILSENHVDTDEWDSKSLLWASVKFKIFFR